MAAHSHPRLDNTDVYPFRFAHEHDLIPSLMPLAAWNWSPVTVLGAIRETIEARPPTAATVTTKMVYDRLEMPVQRLQRHLDTLLRLQGARRVSLNNQGTNHYVQPGYVHRDSFKTVSDSEARIQQARRTALLGLHGLAWLGDAWGLTKHEVQEWCKDYGVPWQAWRRQGRRRLARSLMVLRNWADVQRRDIIRVLPLSAGTFDYLMDRYEANWLPTDPTVGLVND